MKKSKRRNQMKKFLILLTLLLPLITTGCTTVPKTKTVLPPKPIREERQEVTNLRDVSLLINYYEHLIQEWERWGENVSKIVEEEK
jgi:uncharacterized lipoprotein YajG